MSPIRVASPNLPLGWFLQKNLIVIGNKPGQWVFIDHKTLDLANTSKARISMEMEVHGK